MKEMEKKFKYQDLEIEIQWMWKMKTEVIPTVIGALGTIRKGMEDNIRKYESSDSPIDMLTRNCKDPSIST